MAEPARRRLSPGDRRNELLALGVEVFGKRPYDEVRIDEIAERAGVSRALMYHYFPDKRAFFAAVVRAEGERLFEATNTPPRPGDSLFDQLRAGVLAYVYYDDANPHGAWAAYMGMGRSDPVLRGIDDVDNDRQANRIISRVTEAVGSEMGATTERDLRVVVYGWLAYTFELCRQRVMDPTIDGDRVAGSVAAFAQLVETLRHECPWDREQTHDSLTRHLVEETYEVLDAIEHLDVDAGEGYDALEEELGDLLFQVVFHATLAAEVGQFTLADVADGIHDKLRQRHPHVFADVEADDSRTVMQNWEQIKKVEKGRDSVMDGIPPSLPALLLALKVQKKAANAGMDFTSVEGAYEKVTEELGEVRADPTDREVGDLLFAVTGVAQQLGVDPEGALRSAATRFSDRFRLVEQIAEAGEVDLLAADGDAVDQLWEEAKRRSVAD